MNRRSRKNLPVQIAFGTVLVFAAGLALRIAPRYWTTLPFNPDGFVRANYAEQIVADGGFAIQAIRPHGYVFPTLLSQIQLLTGVEILWLTQPVIAVIGAVPCLLAVAFARRLARQHSWHSSRALGVALVAGLILVFQGLFLRRTVWVHYEVLGHLFFLFVAPTFHLYLKSGRRRWLAPLSLLIIVFPITHHLSSMMAALALTAVAAIHLTKTTDLQTVSRSLGIPILFWAYFGGYYIITRPTYFDDLAAKPGLFFAWVIILGGLVIFLRDATPSQMRLTVAIPLSIAFGITLLNAIVDVFPGTGSTHPRLLLYTGPLVILAVFMIWGVPLTLSNQDIGPAVLALLLAPIPFIGFALTAGLSPEYSSFARRAQTFGHFSIAIMAALAVGSVAWRANRHIVLKVGLPLCLLVAVVVSTPLAFAGPPVVPYQSTTTDAEFETITFAEIYVEGAWTSDDHPTRVASNYYDADVTRVPTLSWLQGGSVPECATVVRESWKSVGAIAYPADSIPVEEATLNTFVERSHTVYDGGRDSNRNKLVVPAQVSDNPTRSC